MKKLTKPQAELLAEIIANPRMSVTDAYPPTVRLIRDALITVEQGRFGGTMATVTEAGREALAKATKATTPS
jgi:hypothetical protein